jgi:hypothetical protein
MSNLKKLNQPLNPLFEPDQNEWDKREKELLLKNTTNILKSENIKLPHQRNLDEIIFDTRTVFFKILEISLDKKNPLPYILSDDRNQLAFCVLVISIGVMMLLISNLLTE